MLCFQSPLMYVAILVVSASESLPLNGTLPMRYKRSYIKMSDASTKIKIMSAQELRLRQLSYQYSQMTRDLRLKRTYFWKKSIIGNVVAASCMLVSPYCKARSALAEKYPSI